MKIEFLNVGRNKAGWTEEVAGGSADIIRAIRRKHVLMSRGIDIVWDDNGQGGGIYVGGFRHVGEFRIIQFAEHQLST